MEGLTGDAVWLGIPRWLVALDLRLGGATSQVVLCVGDGRAVEVSGTGGGERRRRVDVRKWLDELDEELSDAVTPVFRDPDGAPVLSGLVCDSQLLVTSAVACTEHRRDLLEVMVTESGTVHRRLGHRWVVCTPQEAMDLLERVHGDRAGHLRMLVEECGSGEHVRVNWIADAEGWWEVAAGAPGRTRVVRRAPEVLVERLAKVLGVHRDRR